MTTTTGAEVAVVESRAGGVLALSTGQTEWTPRQWAALEQMGLAGADEGNLAVFLHQCQRTGLDPFAKQIYMIGRNSKENIRNPDGSWTERWITKYTIQTGINGFRVTARRAAARDNAIYSIGPEEWCGRDGRWRDVWLTDDAPAAARMTITKTDRHGRVETFVATCRWGAYAQLKGGKLQGRWAYAGDQMLSKCAEALAYQRAFPLDLAGVELEDEAGDRYEAPAPAPVTVASRAADLLAGSQEPPVDGAAEFVEATLAAIRDVANVDGWRALNSAVAAAEKRGLGADSVGLLRAELTTRAGQFPAGKRALTKMHAALTERGLGADRNRKLAAVAEIVGRAVTSTTELTGAEADLVWQTASDPFWLPAEPAAGGDATADATDYEDYVDDRDPSEIAGGAR